MNCRKIFGDGGRGGGGRKKDGKDKRKELTPEDLEKKIQKLDTILKKEREDLDRAREDSRKDKVRKENEEMKRKRILKEKRTLESKWEMSRWVAKYLNENETELQELLRDMNMQEEKELQSWHKKKRFEKIAAIRQETRNREEKERNPPTWGPEKERNKNYVIRESSAHFKPENISAIMPVGGEERGGDSRLSPPSNESKISRNLQSTSTESRDTTPTMEDHRDALKLKIGSVPAPGEVGGSKLERKELDLGIFGESWKVLSGNLQSANTIPPPLHRNNLKLVSGKE